MTNKQLIDTILVMRDNRDIKELINRYDKVSEWQDILINIEDSPYSIEKLYKELDKRKVDIVLNLGICEIYATLGIWNTNNLLTLFDIANRYFLDIESNNRDRNLNRVNLLSSLWDSLYSVDGKYEIDAVLDQFEFTHDKIKLDDDLYYINYTDNEGWLTMYKKGYTEKPLIASCIFLGKDNYEIMVEPDINKYENDSRARLIPARNSVIFKDSTERHNDDLPEFIDDMDDLYLIINDDYVLNTNGTY